MRRTHFSVSSIASRPQVKAAASSPFARISFGAIARCSAARGVGSVAAGVAGTNSAASVLPPQTQVLGDSSSLLQALEKANAKLLKRSGPDGPAPDLSTVYAEVRACGDALAALLGAEVSTASSSQSSSATTGTATSSSPSLASLHARLHMAFLALFDRICADAASLYGNVLAEDGAGAYVSSPSAGEPAGSDTASLRVEALHAVAKDACRSAFALGCSPDARTHDRLIRLFGLRGSSAAREYFNSISLSGSSPSQEAHQVLLLAAARHKRPLEALPVLVTMREKKWRADGAAIAALLAQVDNLLAADAAAGGADGPDGRLRLFIDLALGAAEEEVAEALGEFEAAQEHVKAGLSALQAAEDGADGDEDDEDDDDEEAEGDAELFGDDEDEDEDEDEARRVSTSRFRGHDAPVDGGNVIDVEKWTPEETRAFATRIENLKGSSTVTSSTAAALHAGHGHSHGRAAAHSPREDDDAVAAAEDKAVDLGAEEENEDDQGVKGDSEGSGSTTTATTAEVPSTLAADAEKWVRVVREVVKSGGTSGMAPDDLQKNVLALREKYSGESDKALPDASPLSAEDIKAVMEQGLSVVRGDPAHDGGDNGGAGGASAPSFASGVGAAAGGGGGGGGGGSFSRRRRGRRFSPSSFRNGRLSGGPYLGEGVPIVGSLSGTEWRVQVSAFREGATAIARKRVSSLLSSAETILADAKAVQHLPPGGITSAAAGAALGLPSSAVPRDPRLLAASRLEGEERKAVLDALTARLQVAAMPPAAIVHMPFSAPEYVQALGKRMLAADGDIDGKGDGKPPAVAAPAAAPLPSKTVGTAKLSPFLVNQLARALMTATLAAEGREPVELLSEGRPSGMDRAV